MELSSQGSGVREATKRSSLAPSLFPTSVRIGGAQRPREAGLTTGLFSPALGKGPYQLASVAGGRVLVATKAAGSAIVLVSAEDVAPGDIVNFLLTAALYKAKAHGKACLQPHPALGGGKQLPEEGRMLRP